MRSLLVLGLLIALGGSTNAATVHHPGKHQLVSVRHSHVFRHSFGLVVPPVHYDDAPGYNDPSKWGGGAP
jgi:hypothetical protein